MSGRRVIIAVVGGVASVQRYPEAVEVEIRDYDCPGCADCVEDAAGDRYHVQPDGAPCVACGRTDLPLHYNRRCGSCGVDAAPEEVAEPCRECGMRVEGAGGDGWDGLCSGCADRAEQATE